MGDIMENETRMSKYKELRERVRAEMEIEYSVPQNDNIDDDFLGFMSKDETNSQLSSGDDFKVNKYDTKMEILTKIKGIQNEPVTEKKPSLKDKFSQLTSKEPTEKKSFLEKLARLSTKEDVKELEEFIEEEKTSVENNEEEVKDMNCSLLDFVTLLKKEDVENAVKDDVKEETKQEVVEIEEDESKVNKLIDIIILGLVVVLVIFLILILKQSF